jgi:hypothetical protein
MKNKEARRKHRKLVRAEKQRLRRRTRKHRPRKWVYMTVTFSEYETLMALRKYAREHHISEARAIRQIIALYMAKEQNEA